MRQLPVLSQRNFYSLRPALNDAVGGLAYILVDGDRSDAVGENMPRGGVFDVGDVAANVSVHIAVFEDAVASLVEGAILQHHVVGIAK